MVCFKKLNQALNAYQLLYLPIRKRFGKLEKHLLNPSVNINSQFGYS